MKTLLRILKSLVRLALLFVALAPLLSIIYAAATFGPSFCRFIQNTAAVMSFTVALAGVPEEEIQRLYAAIHGCIVDPAAGMSWSPYSTRPRRGNGLRLCCSREPTLRVHPTMLRGEAYLVFFECRSCGKAGDAGAQPAR